MPLYTCILTAPCPECGGTLEWGQFHMLSEVSIDDNMTFQDFLGCAADCMLNEKQEREALENAQEYTLAEYYDL